MRDVGESEVRVHVDEGWLTRDVGVFPFLRKEHFPAEFHVSLKFSLVVICVQKLALTVQDADPTL